MSCCSPLRLRFFASALFLLISLQAFAAFSGLPDHVAANLPEIQKYPKASSVLLWVKDAYTQNTDGSQLYERHEFRYLPDEAARDVWGDPHIAFADDRQSLEVIAARTHTRDGRTIDATPNALNPITPEELDHAPEYRIYKQMVVTLLGLENGSVAELHYTLTTTEPLYPWLSGRVYFREEVPVVARELHVRLPAGRALNYRTVNGAPEPAVSGLSYIWKAGSAAGYAPDDLNGRRELLPHVAFTTAADWAEVAGEFRRRLNAAGDHFDIPASLLSMLRGVQEPEDRVDSIKAWVRERFNLLRFEHPEFALRLRPAGRVLESGYGNPLELAVMVAELSEAAGTAGAPVRAVPWFAAEPAVPSLDGLSGALLFIRADDRVIEAHPLLPGAEFSHAETADASFLFVDGKENITSRRSGSARDAQFRVNLVLDALDSDTLHGTGTLVAQGGLTPYEALREDAAGYVRNLLAMEGLALENVAIKNLSAGHAAVSFRFAAASPDKVDERFVLPAGAVNFARFAGGPNFALERREFAHPVNLPGTVRVHLEAPLPDKWTVSQRPANLSREWSDGSGTRTVEVKDGRVVLEEKLTLGSAWIAPQDWSAFRAFLLETGRRPNNILVFDSN